MALLHRALSGDELKRWFLDVVFTRVLDEGYWKRIFTEKKEWRPEDVAGILFSVTGIPSTVKLDSRGVATSGEICPIALLPRCVLFWDCIFTALTLFHPECWATGRDVVVALHDRIKAWGYDFPRQYQNVDGNVVRWLDALRTGDVQLEFARSWIELTTSMDAYLVLGPIGGFHLFDVTPRRPPKHHKDVLERAVWFKERAEQREWNEKLMNVCLERTKTLAEEAEKMFGKEVFLAQ